jgi:hypothetical protein
LAIVAGTLLLGTNDCGDAGAVDGTESYYAHVWPNVPPPHATESAFGFADAHANDLSDGFDFSQTPLVFQKIDGPLDAAPCLRDF